MDAAPWIAGALGGLGLPVLLWAEAGGRPVPRAVGKLACSAGMVLLAASGGLATPYARWVVAGLALSAVGDALLLSSKDGPFLGGLAVFFAAHVTYLAAFAPVSAPSPWAAAALALAAAGILRWLWPGLGPMRWPVGAYCLVISAMLWLALGTGRAVVAGGAVLFYLSDLALARDRFVRSDVRNRLVLLPLYFAGQYLIALSAR